MNNQNSKKTTEMTAFQTGYAGQGYTQNIYPSSQNYNTGYNYTQATTNYVQPTTNYVQPATSYNYPAYTQPSAYSQAQPQQSYGTYTYNNYGGAANAIQNVYESKPYREDYFNKKIENQIIKRTEAAGFPMAGTTEFDDYFEKHVEKFLTPEIQEILLYHHQGYVFGLQALYRDTWGKANKETFKGDLHMADNVDKKNCECAKLTLGFDEHVKEIFVEANEYVTYIRFVTNQKHILEVGNPTGQEIKNIIPEGGKVLAIAGTHNICLNSVYFYYA